MSPTSGEVPRRTGSLTDPFGTRVVVGHAIVLFVMRRRYATIDRWSVFQAAGESKMDVSFCRVCFWSDRVRLDVKMVTGNVSDAVPEALAWLPGHLPP